MRHDITRDSRRVAYRYIPKDEMEDYTESLMGNYVGIGIYIVENTDDSSCI